MIICSTWRDLEHDLMFSDTARYHPLSAEGSVFFKLELQRGFTVLESLMHVKGDYWQRLPYLLAVLALVDEEEARSWVPSIIAAFQKDPRPPPVHDFKTTLSHMEGYRK